jgi:hypothetical protein
MLTDAQTRRFTLVLCDHRDTLLAASPPAIVDRSAVATSYRLAVSWRSKPPDPNRGCLSKGEEGSSGTLDPKPCRHSRRVVTVSKSATSRTDPQSRMSELSEEIDPL